MVSLREWRTAGIIQCMRVWAVLQEEWLKDGNSIAYASKVPWLFQGGCGWQDMKDIYSQLSPESVDSSDCCIAQSFFVPPLPTFPFALSCSACGVLHRQKTLSTLGQSNNKTRTWIWVSWGVWESSWELGTACMELLSDSHTSQTL